jgi:hypothetical protein
MFDSRIDCLTTHRFHLPRVHFLLGLSSHSFFCGRVCSCVVWGPASVLPGPPPFFRHSVNEGTGYERHIYGISLCDVDRYTLPSLGLRF